jgi:PAS domain S-box-containing protein
MDWYDFLDEAIFDGLLLLGIWMVLAWHASKSTSSMHRSAWNGLVWERAPLGVAMIEYDTGQWLRVNPEIERILGYTSQELTSGMTWMQVTTADTIDADSAEVERVWRGEQTRYTMNKAYLQKTGERIEVRITVTTVETPGVPTFLVFVEDRTKEIADAQNEHAKSVLVAERLERALESVEYERERAAGLLREVIRRRAEQGDLNEEDVGDGE